MVVLIVVGFLIVCLAVDAIIQYRKSKEVAPEGSTSFSRTTLDPNAIIVPDGIYFDKTHTWAYMEKTGHVQVGINDLLQRITGPVTSITLKKPGEKIKKGEKILSIIQEGKKLNIYAPVSGTITRSNNELITHTELLNSSPYSDGWIYQLKPSNWIYEAQFMIMTEKAKVWLKNEYMRIKEFFINYIQEKQLEKAPIILQEGGSLVDHVLKDFGPEIWEDFQIHIIDKGK